MNNPVATYRVQLHAGFTLGDAAASVDLVAALGASHLYVSPVTRAVPGSTHGYDVVDPSVVSPELGGSAALEALFSRLHDRGLALLVDVVPNHRAAHHDDAEWWALLRDGRHGSGARVFDVDWEAPGADGRVVVPMLGAELEDVLGAGDLVLDRGAPEPVLHAPGQDLPVAPGTLPAAGGGRGERSDDLAALLAVQHYRLVFWRDAHLVNYRRFFDIWSLPAVRAEDPEVFAAQLALPLRLLADGRIDAVRVDHVDGLRDPATAVARLRDAGARWLLVEKILGEGETLAPALGADGTTGYEFADRMSGVLVDDAGEAPLTALWAEVSGDDRPFAAVAGDARAEVATELFPADVDRIVRALVRDGIVREQTRDALVALLAGLDVYRTYVPAGGVAGPEDAARIAAAVDRARDRLSADAYDALEEVADALTGARHSTEGRLRFQQLSGAVAAKGVEDTALYRYLRSPARNEVGADPGRFAWSTDEFHERNAAEAARGNQGLLALSTHDSKVSADSRARLAVLTELPGRWRALVQTAVSALDTVWDGVPVDRVAYWRVLQGAVAAWPVDAERLAGYATKASREAKQRTSWRDQDDEYEAAVGRIVAEVVDGRLTRAVDELAGELLVPGRVNALAQVLCQCLGPGVPDVYQGDELWRLSLVDPDNRRAPRHPDAALLAEVGAADARTVAPSLHDPDEPGHPKLFTLTRALALRARRPDCFGRDAPYEAVYARGERAGHVIAFRRGHDVVAVAQRLSARRGASGWGSTTLPLGPARWRDVLSGHEHAGGDVALAELLADFPVAILERA